jgi:hypothetical protein
VVFSKYKKGITNMEGADQGEPAERARLKELADRAGEHLRRVIVVAYRPNEGWIAAFSSMSTTNWAPVFGEGDPTTCDDMERSFQSLIEKFEPRGTNLEEDRAVRKKAAEYCAYMNADYAFVSFGPDGYTITLRVYEGTAFLDEEWKAQSFEMTMDRLQAAMPTDFPDIEETYLGTGRDYGR